MRRCAIQSSHNTRADPETAPDKEVGTVTPDATPPGTPRDTDVGVAVVASGHKEEVAEPVPDAEEAQETEVSGGVDAESASRNVLGSTVPRQVFKHFLMCLNRHVVCCSDRSV